MVKGFGAVPMPVEVAELPTALRTCLVVGQENPLTMISANTLFEVQSHVSMTGHMISLLAVFANDRAWQRLPADERAAATEALREKGQESFAWATADEERLVGELQRQGMTIITEANGLNQAAFRTAVLAQVNQDFPSWAGLITRIGEIR
jgi:TRAP-type C4-dicarboxylate transport system substrate-binding protein